MKKPKCEEKYKVGDIVKLGYTAKEFAEVEEVTKTGYKEFPSLTADQYSYKVRYLLGISGTINTDYKEIIKIVSVYDIIGKIKKSKGGSLGTHLTHCNLGENVGYCKYGYEDCPALREEKVRQKKLFSKHYIKVCFEVAEESKEKAIEVLKEKLVGGYFGKEDYIIE